MKISIIRGAFLNPFELQNYYPLAKEHNIQAISSLFPINDKISLPLKKLPSPTDLPLPAYKYPLLNRVFSDAHYLFGLEKMITNSDIAHVAETYYHYTVQAIKAKQKELVKKVISTVWEIIPHNNEGIRGRKKFKEISRQHIDHFLCPTNLAKEALIIEGVGESKISVIPMGVDLSKFKTSFNEKPTRNLNILFIGRLVPEKGITELFKAFLSLKEKFPNLYLTVVGSGSLKTDITNVRGIKVLRLPYSEIQKEYQKADIFCLPSKTTKNWKEQFGMVLVEAMASGLPIVTTATGAIEEVCGEAVLYAKQASVQDLKIKLENLITSPSLRKNLSKLARKRAQKLYDCQKTALKINSLYQSLF